MTTIADAKHRSRFSPLVLGLILVLVILILPPVVYLIRSSLQEINFDGSFGAYTLRHYQALVETDGLFLVILTSAAYAAGSAFLAILLGGVHAWILERTDTPLRSLAVIDSIVSLGIPSVLYTDSFLPFLSKA